MGRKESNQSIITPVCCYQTVTMKAKFKILENHRIRRKRTKNLLILSLHSSRMTDRVLIVQ